MLLRWQTYWSEARVGVTVAVLTAFSRCVTELGIAMMVGGNIPGETRVVSIAIYDHVETLNYAAAHQMSLLLIAFAFVVLLGMFLVNKRWSLR